LDLFGRSFVLLRIGASAPDVQPLVAAARRNGMAFEVVAIDEPAVAGGYERCLVLGRAGGHVAWRSGKVIEPHRLIATVCGLGHHPDASARRSASQLPLTAKDPQDQETAL